MSRPPGSSGAQRAAEVNEAMLSMPGYADDSMFFAVRYADQAKNTLRECDWREFHQTLDQMTDLWIRSGGGAQPEPEPGEPDQRCARAAAALRAHALDLIKDFPDLVRDFDRFTAANRTAMAAVMRSQSRSG